MAKKKLLEEIIELSQIQFKLKILSIINILFLFPHLYLFTSDAPSEILVEDAFINHGIIHYAIHYMNYDAYRIRVL